MTVAVAESVENNTPIQVWQTLESNFEPPQFAPAATEGGSAAVAEGEPAAKRSKKE
jgi:hypothetical protein